MKETLDEYLTNMIKKSNSYVKINDPKEIKAIYEEFISFFDVSEVEIWNYDTNSKQSTLLIDNSKVLTITTGLSYKAMTAKTAIYSNHVISDKDYNASEDNSHNYKIKSMFVCPIYEHDRLIGLINLYRNISNKKSFTSKDITNINFSAPILSKMLQKILINSDESIQLLQNKKTKKSTKYLSKTTIKQVPTNTKSTIELEIIQKLTEEKKQLENEKQQLQDEKKELIKTLEINKNTLLKVQNSLQTLTSDSQSYEEKITKLKDKNLELEMKNEKILANNEYLKSRHTFLEKILSEKDESSKLNELVRKIYLANQDNETLMTLFELALFIQDFTKIPTIVEESVKKSKITSLLLNMSTFKNNTMNNEKHNITIVLKKILNNCNTILQPTNHKLKVHINNKMPISLVFNARLVESIITRFIIKVPNFLKKDAAINMTVDFSNKELNINLNFNIEKEKKFISLFQSNKDILYDSSQLFYKFNTKLLHSFGGAIHTSYKEDEYKFQLKVPALIIKI